MIVNIGSISAYTSSLNRGEYCVSKAGMGMMTALFADRLAEYVDPGLPAAPRDYGDRHDPRGQGEVRTG